MSRLLLGAGSLAALIISPPFALAYFDAFGGVDEVPPGWLADLEPTLIDRGWLGGGDPEGLYSAYGVWYGVCLVAVFVGLVLCLRSAFGPEWMAGGWGVVMTGIGLSALGTFGDYSGIEVLESLFLLELVGALVVAVGIVLIGVRLWRSERRAVGAVIALVGPVGLVVGSILLGHFPSGPLAIPMMGGVVLAVVGVEWSAIREG